jgi:predicted PurR-regulated permease PerM
MTSSSSGGDARGLAVTITLRTFVYGLAAVLLALAISTVANALLLVFLGVFLGLVAEAPTRLIMAHTRLGRGLAGTIVVLGALVAVTLLALILITPLVRSLVDYVQASPELVDNLRDDGILSPAGDTEAASTIQAGADKAAAEMPETVSGLLDVASGFFSFALAVFTVTFVALFFLSDVAKLKRSLASVLMPNTADRVLQTWDDITFSVSRWAIGAVTIAAIAGTVQGGTAYLLGSSYALALGIIAALLDLIPNIGATIAGFVLGLTLLAEEGLTAALIMVGVVLVYQQIENNTLSPTIYGKAVDLSAFFIITAVSLFGALLGVLGALVAVPLAAATQLVLREVTKARREYVAEAQAALAQDGGPA